jgi:hypothetical protein
MAMVETLTRPPVEDRSQNGETEHDPGKRNDPNQCPQNTFLQVAVQP